MLGRLGLQDQNRFLLMDRAYQGNDEASSSLPEEEMLTRRGAVEKTPARESSADEQSVGTAVVPQPP